MTQMTSSDHIVIQQPLFDRAIEEKRRQLLRTAEKYGRFSPETLSCSQELDRMIVNVQASFFHDSHS